VSVIDWQGPPIQVIGVGPNPARDFPDHLRVLLDESDLIIGAPRHLDGMGVAGARARVYPSPLSGFGELLRSATGERVTVLASGDPLLFGIGAWLGRHLPAESLCFHPNVTSIQAAFASIGLPWQDARILSLHGRPLRRLLASVRLNRLYAVLTDATNHPAAIARLLAESGFGRSTLWVAEDLGTPSQQVRRFTVAELVGNDPGFSPLNVAIIETGGSGGLIPEFPGIPDEAFSTDGVPGRGMLSKREVRLAALSLLQPRAREIGWDVGAGCGGISVEWALWAPLASIHAVEKNTDRLTHLRVNQERFGASENLHVVPGEAPGVLGALPDPDAVFLGGNDGGIGGLLDAVWTRLRPEGRLVTAAVTEESRSALLQFARLRSPEWIELGVARGDRLAGQTILRPSLPVLLCRLAKP